MIYFLAFLKFKLLRIEISRKPPFGNFDIRKRGWFCNTPLKYYELPGDPRRRCRFATACLGLDTLSRAAALPQTETVRDAGFGILYMTDEADDFVVRMLDGYNEKKFCNVSTDDLGLETDLEKADTEKKAEENKELLDFVKETLGGEVEAVRLSHKLKSHPVFLSTEGEITLETEKYFNSLPGMNMENMKAKKVLELNGSHAAFAALQNAFANEDKERAASLSKILLAQAKLIAGLPLDDPSAYAELVCGLF